MDYKSCLVTALYEKNILTGIKVTDISYDNIPESINVTADKADSAKVFIWDILNGMKPSCDAIDVEITTE